MKKELKALKSTIRAKSANVQEKMVAIAAKEKIVLGKALRLSVWISFPWARSVEENEGSLGPNRYQN